MPGIDLCEYHDYQRGALPGDEWNGLTLRVRQCRVVGKPLFVASSESGRPHRELYARAGILASKLTAQFAAGVVGVLAWNWRDERGRSSSQLRLRIGPDDPALAVLGAF